MRHRLIMQFITPLSHLVNKAAAVHVIDLLVHIKRKLSFTRRRFQQTATHTHTHSRNMNMAVIRLRGLLKYGLAACWDRTVRCT